MACVFTPTLRWSNGANSGFTAPDTLAIPAGGTFEVGNRLILIGGAHNTGVDETWAVKSGWTKLFEGGIGGGAENGNAKVVVYTRVVDGTETASELIDFNALARMWGIYLCYENSKDVPVIGVETVVDAASPGTVLSMSSVVSARDRDVLLGVVATANVGAATVLDVPVGWDLVRREQNSSGPVPLGAAISKVSDPLIFDGEDLGTVDFVFDTSTSGVTIWLRMPAQCGRTTTQVLEELLSFLPPEYQEATDLLGGVAAQIAQQESEGCDLFDLATVARGIGKWLTLHGTGLGFLRGSGETDEAYGERIRTVEDRVTRPAIVSTVETLLDTVPIRPGVMIEWYESPCLDLAPFFLDTVGAALSPGKPGFIIALPDIGNDDLFNDSVYDSIANALNSLRAAGVRAYMVLADVSINSVPNRRGVLGWPTLVVTGDITSQDRAGFDIFDASNHAVVDYGRLSTNNVRMWALRFSFTSVPTTEQVLLGSDGTDGVALWMEIDGTLELRIDDGTTTVSETLTAITVEVSTEYWVFLQADIRTTGGGSIAGIVAIGRAGDLNVHDEATFQPAAGVDMDAFTDEQRVGNNLGSITGSPAESADQTTIHEIREYDSAAEAFVFTTAIIEAILAGTNDRVDRIDLQYDGSDDVLV